MCFSFASRHTLIGEVIRLDETNWAADNTTCGPMTVVNRQTQQSDPQVEWVEDKKRCFGDQLSRNLTVTAALLLCAVLLRQGTFPGLSGAADAVVTAVSNDELLNDALGKLTFVGNFFPQAQSVFGEQADALSLPVSAGELVHTWSQSEPYLEWATSVETVTASSAGQVIGVYHGNGDERLVQVLGDDGIACLYGNLQELSVSEGERVKQGDVLGTLLPGMACVMEVRQNGVLIDPTGWLSP